MKHIEIIFFDFDGTLVDSIPDIVYSVNYTLKSVRLSEKSYEEVKSYIGRGQKYLIQKSLGDANQNLSEKALLIFDTYYAEHFHDHMKLYPGVKEALEYVKNKILIILTNKKHAFVQEGNKVLGIDSYFREIAAGDTAHCMKPDPCVVEDLLKKYNIEQSKAIIVGDMDIDIKTGKNAGILTCGVTYGLGSRESLEKAGADYIVESLVELKQILS